ncbi:MAG: PaaI family thioesterase, partial [Lachnospiraceae bacterium]|nr:PaaI family thioesterase [Lachnospiraceae bacterium]
MSTFATTEEAREYFINDLFASRAGMRLDELTEDSAVCSVEITEALQNANGGVMGGAIFTLADLALAAIANNIHKPAVASQVSINYLSA